MRILMPFFFFLLLQPSFAAVKTWNGGAAGSWTNAANWSPAGVPVVATNPLLGDDIIFDGSLAAIVTITDYPAQVNTDFWGQLSLINNVTVNLSSGSNTYMYCGNGVIVNAGCRLNIGATTSTFFEFGNKKALINSCLIYGTLEMQGTGTDATNNRKVFSNITTSGSTKIFGKLIMSAPAAQLAGASQFSFSIENGGEMQWARDGYTLPGLTCQDGGIVNITGIITAPLIFNNFGAYLGLIIWNCPSQTGFNIPVVPSVGLIFNVDSVRIVNTGSGSACLGLSPCFAVGHLEVQGGIMNLGSPTAAISGACVNTRINTDLKLTGGTLIGNATFSGDGIAAHPYTLPIQRDLIITGGTFNLTNRPTGLTPGGAMQLNVSRNISQSGGNVFATSSFGSQNNINMNGFGSQTLELDNMTDIGLTVSNNSILLGVTLADHISIASSCAFTLNKGYVKLDNYTLTVPANRFFQNVFSPMPKIVTNGFGKLKLTGITASSTKVFPVAPFAVNSYDPVTITTTAGATTNDYSVRVQRGIASGAMYSFKVMNRTWTINGASTIIANTVGLTYQYNDTAKQALCLPAAGMEEGHFAGGVWNVDPAATLITPAGSNPYTVGPFYPNSIDSSFAIGNLASILAINNSLELAAQKNSNNVALHWQTNNTGSVKQFAIERSADGRNFTFLFNNPVNNFSYTDMSVLPGLNYYRIRMTDNDGRINYSNVAAILNAASGTSLLNIVPNPVTDGRLRMQVASAIATDMHTQVMDLLGRNVDQKRVHLIAGYNILELNIAALAPGTYTVYGIVAGERTKVLRFVKQ
ncbi:MAG: hypothetical protein WAT20_02440 [Ferruginibacter sp.]